MIHKRKFILLISIIFVFGLIYFNPLLKSFKSCKTFRKFCNCVRDRDWSSAQNMLLTQTNGFRVENGAVLYDNHNITYRFRNASPRFYTTFYYYLHDRSMGDKVIFQGGYALLENGKIKFVKIP